jgi:aerobic-type carbon monoxide dehydrogenase small subunit (CoxS/CutS family)
MIKRNVEFVVNGKKVSLEVRQDERLVDVLRNQLGLKGTKAGCREGECGTCSVILNGKIVPSCLVPVMKADGGTITTVEGLEQGGELHPLQKAFIEKGAVQCGFCTPGMLLSAKNLLDQNPEPTVEEIKRAISGVLCRCTGYRKIVQAIQAAGQTMKASR